jgi:CRISPR-associated endonuclease Cas2
VERLRAQIAAADDPARVLAFGRAVVAAKIRKQAVLLKRFVRRGRHEAVVHGIGLIEQLLGMLPECAGRDELMGIEGAAAHAYFEALGHLVPEPLAFAGRTRQPPLDVVNSALSFGYTVLAGEADRRVPRHRTGMDRHVMAMTTLVCYDISSDSTRARAAAILQQCGDRVQRSVLICTLTTEDLADVTRRLAEIIDADHDSVYLLPVCAACWDSVVVLGQAEVAPPALYWAVL